MVIKRLILIFLLFAPLSVAGGAQAHYEMSVLTCAPGSEVYSVFGHTGLRVRTMEGEELKGDVVYNFGLFDFDEPAFVLKFVRGDLDYYVGIQPTDRFVASYFMEGRGVVEQPLNITAGQASDIMEWLSWRVLPENAPYKYKFLARNCTTEVRDLVFEYTDLTGYDLYAPSGRTFRQYLDECLAGAPWLRLGIDLVLGSRVDREMDACESMFLPHKYMLELESAGNGAVSLVKATEPIQGVAYEYPAQSTRWRSVYPSIVLVLLFVVCVFVRRRWVSVMGFVIAGLLGSVLTWAGLYSGHVEFGANFNLLWCNPIWLVLAFVSVMKWGKAVRVLSWTCDALITASAIVAISGLQRFPVDFWVIWAILLVFAWRENRRLSGKLSR